MTDPREALSKIKARAAEATPGPWEYEGRGEIAQHWTRPEPWKTIVSTDVRCMSHCLGGSAEGVVEEADAEFITHARTDIDRLTEALEAVLAEHEPIHALDYNAPVRGKQYTHVCTGCGQDSGNWQYWPCPTVHAITTALTKEDA